MLNGSITDLVTPMTEGELDLEAFAELVEWQITAGCHGLVVGSRAGEAATLTLPELSALVQRCVAITEKRVPIIAAAGVGDLPDTLARINELQKLAIDGVLLLLPSIHGATATGIAEYVRLIHDDTGATLFLDHDPERTGCDLSVDAMIGLLDLPRVVGVREASPDITRATTLRARMNKPAAILSGLDTTAAAFLAQGGHGIMSVTANCAPALCIALQNAWRDEDIDAFEDARDQLATLNTALMAEAAPIGVKYALQRLGMCGDDVRLPLAPASAKTRENVDKALAQLAINTASSAGLAA